MGQERNEKTESLTHVLAEDHRRLDALLQAAMSHPDKVEPVAYDQFRSGLLRHIGVEENFLSVRGQLRRFARPTQAFA